LIIRVKDYLSLVGVYRGKLSVLNYVQKPMNAEYCGDSVTFRDNRGVGGKSSFLGKERERFAPVQRSRIRRHQILRRDNDRLRQTGKPFVFVSVP